MCERYAETLAKHHEGRIYSPGAARGGGFASDCVTLGVVRIVPARPNDHATHYLSRRKNKFGRRTEGVI